MKNTNFDLKDMSFAFDGMSITNPTCSSCGRFTVDPITEYGFEIEGTGGGCTALQKKVEGGWVVLSREVSHDLGDTLTPFLMGFYDGSQDDDTETMWGNELGIAELQVGILPLTHDEIDDLAEEALNAMCLKVQSFLGIKHGDNAADYFSDGKLKDQIKDYIKNEISVKRASYETVWEGNND
jgi:hypothetical protein